jgi:thioredoxin-like negative regulator of GroEL
MLALAPLTAASASQKTKGSAPKSALCKEVKNEQKGSTATGLAISKAMTSGNFASAKQALLKAYTSDFNSVQKALAVVKTAPPKVQAAFKNLLSSVKQFRNAIQNASSEQALITSFAALGKNTQLASDGNTIANWFTSVCGGTLITSTTVSVP